MANPEFDPKALRAERQLFPMYHDNAERACHDVAFYTRRRLQIGQVLAATDVVLADGSPAIDGTIVKCGSCGLILSIRELAYRGDEIRGL